MNSTFFSRWQRHAFLLHPDEMGALFEQLSPFSIYQVSSVVDVGQELIAPSFFLSQYASYFSTFLENEQLDLAPYRALFSSAWVREQSSVSLVEVKGERRLVRPLLPVIQLQAHQFYYDPGQGKFFSMPLGKGNRSWGIQASFPYIFQRGAEGKIEEVDKAHPEYALYTTLARFLRKETTPAPFMVGGEKKYAPFRVGKVALPLVGKMLAMEER